MAWQEKLKQLKDDMRGNLIDTLIITALDETAWTLNLRGGDVPYTPVFRSYLVINLNYTTLYLPSEKLSEEIIEYLNANGSEPGDSVRYLSQKVLKRYYGAIQNLKRNISLQN